MKVLWITNIMLPPICEKLGVPALNIGGWMMSSASSLIQSKNIDLAIATVYNGKSLFVSDVNGIRYYLLPNDTMAYNPKLEPFWIKIKNEFCPDVVHIHGTEFPYGIAYLRACGNDNVVCSIQGLVSVYAYYYYYYYGGLSIDVIKKFKTLNDYRVGGIEKGKIDYEKRGVFEIEYLKTLRHVIGRTTWDHDHCWAINPDCNYHFCNETLRPRFYDSQWRYEKCNKHSIFVSQASYPLKGFHKILEALPYILRHFPDTRVRVAGTNILDQSTWKSRIKISGYANYLLHLMKKNNIMDVVSFTGSLNEEQMVNELLNANVSICPSAIENSPNSLGEAQLVGTPLVASYVGGIPDMVEHGRTGLLYRFEEAEMLASHVCKIFSNIDLANHLSIEEREAAQKRHDSRTNCLTLMNIYNLIGQEGE